MTAWSGKIDKSQPFSERGNDKLVGGAGNDWLDGQGGADTLIDKGGDAETTFVDWDGGDTWTTTPSGAGVNTFVFHGPFDQELIG